MIVTWIKRGLLILFGFLCLVILLVGAAMGYRVYHQAQLEKLLHIDTTHGIQENVAIEINGVSQWLNIRGHNITNPILLFIHGGPGKPEVPYLHLFQQQLERRVTVVHWEQRGAGRSYSDELDLSTLTLEQFISDGIQVIDYLRARFVVPKVFVMGHSWGSILGLHLSRQHPEGIQAYFGMGQASNFVESLREGYRFLLKKASNEGMSKALSELKAVGEPPYTFDQMLVYYKWLMHFGGEVYGQQNYYGVILESFMSPIYSLKDHQRWAAGMTISARTFFDEILSTNLMEEIPSLDVPVVFLLGRHDYNTSSRLASDYFEVMVSPKKQLIWYEKSAHSPNLEEPERFQQDVARLIHELKPKAPQP